MSDKITFLYLFSFFVVYIVAYLLLIAKKSIATEESEKLSKEVKMICKKCNISRSILDYDNSWYIYGICGECDIDRRYFD
jgi:hypothetical protein